MLRHCRLCARQLEYATAAASPIASTSSSHIFARPARSKRARQHAKRLFSSSVPPSQGYEQTSAATWTYRQRREPYQSGPGAALWKGKGRAVEPLSSESASHEPEKSQVPHEPDSGPIHTDPSASSSTTTASEPLSEPDESRQHLSWIASSLLRIMSDIAEPPEGRAALPLEVALEDLRQFAARHAQYLSPYAHDILERVQKTTSDTLHLLPSLASVFLDFVQARKLAGRQNNNYRKWLASALTRLEDAPDARNALAVASIEAYARRGNDISVINTGRLINKAMGVWIPEVLETFIRSTLEVDTPEAVPLPDSLPHDLPTSTCNLLITSYIRARHLDAARGLFRALQQRPSGLEISTARAVLAGYRAIGASHNLYAALAGTVRDLHLPHSTKTVNMLIECCLASGDLRGAHELFKQFEDPFDGSPSVIALGPGDIREPAQLSAPAAVASERNTEQGLGTAKPRDADADPPPGSDGLLPKLKPDGNTLSLFVRGYIASGDLEAALDSIIRMMDDGFSLGATLGRALRMAYAQQGQPPAGSAQADLLDHVLSHGLHLRADAERATEDYRERASDFHIQIKEELDSGSLVGVPDIVDTMTEEGIPISSKALSWIVSYVAKHSGPKQTADALLGMRTSRKQTPALSEFNIMLDALVKEEEHVTARNRNLARKLQKISSEARSSTAAAAGKHAFQEVVEQLRETTLAPDPYTCAIIMRRAAQSRGSPRAIWDFFQRQILNRGIQPAPHHILALMVAYCKADDPYGARRALARGEVLGVKPNVQQYSVLLSHYARALNADNTRSLFQEMRSRGIKPDLGVYVIIAHAAARWGHVHVVYTINRQYKIDFPDAPFPEPALVASIFRCRNTRREYTLAQDALADAMDKGMIPDAVLVRIIWRCLKDHQVNLNRMIRRDAGADTFRMQEAIELARKNLSRALQLAEGSKDRAKAQQDEEDLEKALVATLAAISRNREALEADVVQFDDHSSSSNDSEMAD